jgi:hypothetical protein
VSIFNSELHVMPVMSKTCLWHSAGTHATLHELS